ncbi:hypothetical protein DOK78_000314 [Enterococcus sp. DIV2402]|uniref:SMODS and SLOG-associating 2TM effector domain-containing protein n=1 Tax=Candidatus Enterococcus lowellii TaxID=2230877 RepID=A0ABZ2SJR1_9ENTE|nr:hypothetical protein [Enterococcus sp. DIV2402]MBO0464801.1 hypothetical protein [Enterococcus sp. DIV2402]
MNKEELLTSLSYKQQVTKEVTRLEKLLNKKLIIEEKAKRQWNKRIIVFGLLSILGFITAHNVTEAFSGVIFGVITGWLVYVKINKIKTSSYDVQVLRKKLDEEMSKTEYLMEVQNFPIEFYDYDSIFRLYSLIKDERASNLKEAFNLLENQRNAEYQNNLAEQSLASVQATERSARVTAISSTISAFNTSKK